MLEHGEELLIDVASVDYPLVSVCQAYVEIWSRLEYPLPIFVF
jgi:hypothetical protein